MAIPYSRYIVGSLPWYSVLMVSGILIAYLLGTREEKRIGLPKDSMLDMVLVAVPCGIVGARLYYVLMTLSEFAKNPISILYIWEGGIAVYGSIIGGALGVYIYCRVRKRSFAALLDITAPGLVLAQAIGRWGNYFNREAFGPVITNTAWQFFPAGVQISENGAEVWHVATFFYESMWDWGVFLVLWALRKRVKRHGDVFLWYMVLYGCGRFLVEQLRTDSLYLFGYRVSQYVSLLICAAVAVVFIVRFAKKHHGVALAAVLCAGVLAFARPLLAQSAAGVAFTLALYAAGGVCLLLWHGAPRFAKFWLFADAAVYLAMLLLGLNGLWQSPYFVYAGLSVPPYLAIPYACLARELVQAKPAEVE
ncbi:MAG: prolipoprotein diacylglyceryl transferase [Eubacteriales bacterium]|nr:prolipoprotein diacylglyceryl transferase [Eubacteriales bacterium]